METRGNPKFVKGGPSPNPKGRPKDALKLKNLCQELGQEAINVLKKAMKEAPEWSDRIKAAKEILDRGYGKPAQAVELSGPDGEPFTVNIIRKAPSGA